MLYDKIDRLSLYTSLIPYASHIAQAFAENDKTGAMCEVREIWGATRAEGEATAKKAENTIDLILMRSGSERVSVSLDDAGKSDVYLHPGEFLALYPGETYTMQLNSGDTPGMVEKWYCRLPSPSAFCLEEEPEEAYA